MHFTTEKVTSKCDFLSLKQVYAHFCTALYMNLTNRDMMTRWHTEHMLHMADETFVPNVVMMMNPMELNFLLKLRMILL